jgi:leucyl/phenylalanyl-tRNA--protein transferase
LRDKQIIINFAPTERKNFHNVNSRNNFDPKELLKPDNMLRLYASGAFPMADEKGETINWYMPEIRTIIPLDAFNFPRSTRKAVEKMNFEIKFDTDFTKVVMGCSDREDTWISQELINAYKRLRKRGHVHSVETWLEGEMVGGLYGVTFRGAFFGESMFSNVSEASKAALMALINHLIERDFILLDVQYMSEHLKMFGAIEISFDEYTNLLHKAYTRGCEF